METVLAILVATITVAGILYCIVKPTMAIVPVLMMFPAEQIVIGYFPEMFQRYHWLINVVVGLIAVFGVAYKFFRDGRLFQGMYNSYFFLLMGFYSYIAVSLLWTFSPDSAYYFIGQSWPYFILFYLVSPLLLKGLDEMADINVPLILSGSVIMAMMLVNPHARFNNDRFIIDLGYVIGYGDLVSNPLAIADAGAILAIVAALYQPSKSNTAITVCKWTGVLLGLTLALMSGSRVQVVAAVGIIAIGLPYANGTRSAARVAGSLLAIGVVLGFLYYGFTHFLIDAGQSRWTGASSAEGLNSRLDFAISVLSGFIESPAFWLIGMGASSFNAFYLVRSKEAPFLYPHNIVIESLTEYGVIGLILVSIILLISVKYALRLLAVAGDDRRRRTTAVIWVGMVVFQIFMCMKQGYLLGMPPLFMVGLIVARVTMNEEAAARARSLEQPEEPLDDTQVEPDELYAYPEPA